MEFELRKPVVGEAIAEIGHYGTQRRWGDVAQLELDVTDKDGTLVPDAANVVTCSVEGPGGILGIENGEFRSTEDYQSLTRHAYQGRMRIYVQAAKTSGELRVSVSAPLFEPNTVSLQVRSPDRPAR